MISSNVRMLALGSLLTMIIVVGGCSRPTGDFNRPTANFFNDKANPAVGRKFAKWRKEPVSFFGRTDEEKRLIDIVDDISRPLHVRDWISGTLIEGERSRIFPKINHKLNYRAYLFWLRKEPFLSSETRWNRIAADIRADQGLVPPFYGQARLVHTIDGERKAYLEETPGIDVKYRMAANARHEENEALFERALDSFVFRYQAYDHAIKHFIVETPSPRAQIAAEELHKYKKLIEAGGELDLHFLKNDVVKASRIKSEDKKRDEKVEQK